MFVACRYVVESDLKADWDVYYFVLSEWKRAGGRSCMFDIAIRVAGMDMDNLAREWMCMAIA